MKTVIPCIEDITPTEPDKFINMTMQFIQWSAALLESDSYEIFIQQIAEGKENKAVAFSQKVAKDIENINIYDLTPLQIAFVSQINEHCNDFIFYEQDGRYVFSIRTTIETPFSIRERLNKMNIDSQQVKFFKVTYAETEL